ncbi:MAG: hypothetical protein KKB21_02015 [Nanoarchaeota archaeon]|nr:hypothetical protein [Nanoarchaeota archaeon]MBU4086330.1 hypothetical protein [Nanoarchaeota archaeon]
MGLEHFREIRQALVECGIEEDDADSIYGRQRVAEVLGDRVFMLAFLENLGFDPSKIISGGALDDRGKQAIVNIARAAKNYRRAGQLNDLKPGEVYDALNFNDIERLVRYGKDLRRRERE